MYIQSNLNFVRQKLRFVFIFLLIIFLTSCQSKPTRQRYQSVNVAYGERVSMDVCIDPDDQGRVEAATQEAWEAVSKVEHLIDIWDPQSEAAQVNRSYGHPVKVSPKMYALLKEAVGYSTLTKGTFDITVQPLIQLWKKSAAKGHPPSKEEIDEVRKAVGVKYISFLPDNTVELLNPQTKIDLGGLGANVAVDDAVGVLRKHNYHDFMVAAAGDMYMSGHNCKGEPWQIGILNPLDKSKFVDVLSVSDMAVSTSGDYERFLVIEGKKYSHDMNPITGYPQTGTTSGTAIAPSIKEAGALAKALVIFSPAQATSLMDALGPPYASMVIYKPTEDSLQLFPSHQYGLYVHDRRKS